MVEKLVELLIQAPTPFTLSLSGAWGVGKSAIAETAQVLLQGRGIAVCYVDAWSEETDSLRRTIVIQAGARLTGREQSDVAGQIDERLLKTISSTRDRAEFDPSAERVKEAWTEHRRLFLGVLMAVTGLLALLVLSTIWGTDADQSGQWFWDLIRSISAGFIGAAFTFLVFRSGLFLTVVTENESVGPPAAVEVALANEFRKLVAPAQAQSHKVVIIVDNLDRLQAVDALDALAEIRALVEIDDHSRCLFLIPIDREAFVEQLAGLLGGPEAARDYLDKFFNLDVQLLGPAPVQMSRFASGRADKLGLATSERDATIKVVVAGARTPRFATRVMNGAVTRQYLLSDVPDRPSLELLTFVEVLATAYPDLGRYLASDPLTFVEQRRQLLETSDPAKRASIAENLLEIAARRRRQMEDPGASQEENASVSRGEPSVQIPRSETVDRLQRFLAATHAVDASAEDIQLASLLRPDPIWHGVTNAIALRQTMHAGDREAFNAALAESDDGNRALKAALDELSKNATEGRNDLAIRGIGAAGDKLLGVASFARDLYGHAVDAATGVDTAQLASAPPSLIRILEGTRAANPAHQRRVWDRIQAGAAEVAASESKKFGQLVAIAIAALPATPKSDGIATASAFEAAGHEDLRPLFEPRAVLDLISPKLIARYQSLISGWNHEEDDADEVLLATHRFAAVLGTGWEGDASLEAIATDITAKLPTYEPSANANEVLASMVGLFEGAESSPAIDAFAKALMEEARTDASLAIVALRLPFTDAAIPELKASLEGYLTSSYEADDLNRIGDESASALTRLSINILQHCASRWIAAGDQSFLDMVMDRGKGGDACFAALDARPSSAATMDLAVQLAAASHARRRTGLLKRLAVKAGNTVAALPSSAVATYVEAFVAASHGIDAATDRTVSMALAHALHGPIATAADASAVGHFVAAGIVIGTPDAEREVAIAVAERANAVPIVGIAADALGWLIRRSHRAAATGLLRREIEAGNQLSAMANVARTERGHLSSERQVRTAFVSAAAQLSGRGPAYGATAEQVGDLLRVAAGLAGSSELGSDEKASVEAIANGPFSDDEQLTDVVGLLRGPR